MCWALESNLHLSTKSTGYLAERFARMSPISRVDDAAYHRLLDAHATGELAFTYARVLKLSFDS